ncbi:hypothetical protein B0I35DRAFT_136156 [Stachybotrys elegans]|uniref:Gfd2/YDR514C-like C-terminal domain-containing protein n=1 Tax=Stachybotrys elegans TaxID=80388 RepID=A0A8K0T4S6_9HYPO|nr:hypothetical protein B0I35DRAFT_136156 [Stachybotrys elegans]
MRNSMERKYLPDISKAKLKPPLGGLKVLERFLGLRPDHSPAPGQDATLPDAVLVSLDLEVASSRELVSSSGEKPAITQIGFAVLDTRDLSSYPLDLRSLISVRFFTVSDITPQTKTARNKQKRRCVFATPRKITQRQISTTILQNLQIRDKSGHGSLRNIALIGQSIKEDLKVIQYLGLNLFDLVPIWAVIDTYLIARYLLPPYSPDIRLAPGQRFSLSGILSQLGCSLDPMELHNAGNDAVYTMYAVLLLVITSSTNRMAQLSVDEQKKLETLRLNVLETLEKGVSITEFRAPPVIQRVKDAYRSDHVMT